MPEAEAPVVWGDFEVRFDRLLGRGGMGSVYEARQVSLDRTVAVKVLDTDRAPTEELVEGFLAKFQHEARALAKLNDPRIVTILQAGRADGKCWYAMERVEGNTVDQRLSETGSFEPVEAARIAAEVARALAVALAQGIIHRDVKPANIFLTPDGRVKLGDFGLARSGGFKPTRFTEMNAVAGTPEYASPEQAANQACDHRSDQYSLGAVLFEMVTERPPFGGANALETFFKHAHEPPPRPSRFNPAVPGDLEVAILRCLEKDPARRFPNYEEFIRALEAVRPAPLLPVADPPEMPQRPTLAIRTSIVAALVLAGFSIWGATRILSEGPELPPKPPPPVARVEMAPPPPAPVPPPEPPPPAEPRKPEPDPAMERKAAWDAVTQGDGVALAAYLEKTPDKDLEDELAGIREPFSHPNSQAHERAIRDLYARRNHERVPIGEVRSWKPYPDTTSGSWRTTAAGLALECKSEQSWMAREFSAAKGFTVTFKFTPGAAPSWAGVAVSPMTPDSFFMVHVLQSEGRRLTSLVDRTPKKTIGLGEREIEAAGAHEIALVERQGRFACFVDGRFLRWHDGPGPGDRIAIGVNRGEVVVTEVRIAR